MVMKTVWAHSSSSKNLQLPQQQQQQHARGNEINTARRSNASLTCRFAVF
jgi:hypothetical protein